MDGCDSSVLFRETGPQSNLARTASGEVGDRLASGQVPPDGRSRLIKKQCRARRGDGIRMAVMPIVTTTVDEAEGGSERIRSNMVMMYVPGYSVQYLHWIHCCSAL